MWRLPLVTPCFLGPPRHYVDHSVEFKILSRISRGCYKLGNWVYDVRKYPLDLSGFHWEWDRHHGILWDIREFLYHVVGQYFFNEKIRVGNRERVKKYEWVYV